MPLHELCNAYTISRRTVQEYEKHGLVKATGRNMRGYLLYDSQMQAEIRKVRQFQNFGFQVKEIKTLMALPKAELHPQSLYGYSGLPCHSYGLLFSAQRADARYHRAGVVRLPPPAE